MNEPEVPTDPHAELDLGRLLGLHRAFAAAAGRCSAAQAQLLRHIHDDKLYRPLAPSWRAFCGPHLAVSRRHADRLIALLKRFGPVYFEISQLVGISPRQYLAIEPTVREHSLLVNGEAVSLIPEGVPKILEAVSLTLRKPRRPRRPALSPDRFRASVFELTNVGRTTALQLLGLFHSCHSRPDQMLVLDAATELRGYIAHLESQAGGVLPD